MNKFVKYVNKDGKFIKGLGMDNDRRRSRLYMGRMPKGRFWFCIKCDSSNIVCIREYSAQGATTWERCKNCGYEWVWKE